MSTASSTDRASWRRRLTTFPYAMAGGVLALAAVVESVARYRATGATGAFIALMCCLGLVTTAPLALRRESAAAALILAVCMLSLVGFQTVTAAGVVAQVLAAFRLGRGGGSRLALLLGAPYLVLALSSPAPSIQLSALVLAVMVPTAGLAGLTHRVHREDADDIAAQQAFAGTLLENGANRERARIARELHDIVAHHISMISVLAETARLTTPGMPPAGAEQLSAIGDTARSALTEMRRLLGVLRENVDAAPVERAPQPGLRQLNDLLDEARDAAGSSIRLILRGAPSPLDPSVELAAYRIVQEALTNARRHAPGAAVDVELRCTDTALHLLIRDNGPGAPALGSLGGHGLVGMCERAAAVGGRLRTGMGSSGGFLVAATLPSKQKDLK